MTLGTDIYAALQALASGRVYPLIGPPGAVAPYIAWQAIAGEADYHVRGPSGLHRTRVQIDIWAATYAAAQSLADSARTAMRASTAFSVAGEFDLPDDYDPESDTYRVSLDLVLWHG